jgi:hypothetical protein
MAEKVVRLPKAKLIITVIASLAIMQSGYVLAKTYSLRKVPPPLEAAIQYFKQHPPSPPKVLMYPEGNHILFTVPSEWYMDWRIREFWRANNDQRINMLHQFNIGAVVVKKHLISKSGIGLGGLGGYPERFVSDLTNDPRFEIVLENDGVIIFKTPGLAKARLGRKTPPDGQ